MEIAFLALALAVAGVAGFIHTAFFVYKMFVSRGTAGYEQINYEEQALHNAHTHGSSDLFSGSVPLSSMEVTCFMGVVWSACVHHDRMSKSTFVGWYITVMSIDIGLSVLLYFLLSLYLNI